MRVEEYIRSNQAKGSDYQAVEWREEFRKFFAGKGGDIKGLAKQCAAGRLRYVSRCSPDLIFGARGVGEEFNDVWVSWPKGGKRGKSPAKDD